MLVFFLFGTFKIKEQNSYAQIIFFIVLTFSLTESILNRQYGIQLYSIFIPLIFKDSFKKIR